MRRPGQRIGGVLMAALGLGSTSWGWYTALWKGYFYPKAALLMPVFFVLGTSLIVFPGYREERLARGEDVSALRGWDLLTPRWKIILAAALVLGGVNCAALSLFGR